MWSRLPLHPQRNPDFKVTCLGMEVFLEPWMRVFLLSMENGPWESINKHLFYLIFL